VNVREILYVSDVNRKRKMEQRSTVKFTSDDSSENSF
jgi:hypothetical protein